MMLAMGVLAALEERHRSGLGQVVEAAMSDGALGLMAQWYSMRGAGHWVDERDSNLTDGGAPFYRCYETSDGRYVAVGAIERKFYAELIDGLGLDPSLVESQMDTTQYPAMHQLFADTFATRTRDEWAEIFATRDACLTPALTMPEAPHHPHNVARGSFLSVAGSTQVAPPVRFGRTPACVGSPAPDPGAANDDVLRWLGLGRRRDRPAPSDTRRRVIASHQR
jgi:alpha-methylacyl-CoA racemase